MPCSINKDGWWRVDGGGAVSDLLAGGSIRLGQVEQHAWPAPRLARGSYNVVRWATRRFTTMRVSCSSPPPPSDSTPGGASRREALEQEKQELQDKLHYIEALVQRNEAQIYSFVDEQHQWESQSEEDRQDILSRPWVEARIEEIDEILADLTSS
mmetsp:Transcript_17969/g.34085  ORF Transcript_17969/g.34085 Transcript_17969/m.34085 type:complete len:155 (-) Transcript_17969:204-668(-)